MLTETGKLHSKAVHYPIEQNRRLGIEIEEMLDVRSQRQRLVKHLIDLVHT